MLTTQLITLNQPCTLKDLYILRSLNSYLHCIPLLPVYQYCDVFISCFFFFFVSTLFCFYLQLLIQIKEQIIDMLESDNDG